MRGHGGSRPVTLSRCRPRQIYSASVLLSVLCLAVLVINLYEVRMMQVDHATLHVPPQQPPPPPPPAPTALDRRVSRPIVWVYGKKLETGYLQHVFNVFERIGYETGDAESDWTVLWSHLHPFNVLSRYTSNLKPHQKVNHFPGSGALTSKANLVKIDIPLIPKAFRVPSELQGLQLYAKQHPEKLWVQKGSAHRGIRISSVDELAHAGNDAIVQEYVDKPLLIDGRRFDIGLYVTITSIDPLRVYVFQGEWLFRFCMKDYEPFDTSDINKYVITDDYTPLWQMPSLQKYYSDLDSNRKEAFFAYFRSQGKDPEKLSSDLEDAIRQVCYLKEKAIISAMSAYQSGNFFEMVRFDFVVNEDLHVFLMEVNMSPNLSSGHFAKNKLIYEQVIYNTLSLVGLATTLNAAEARSMSLDTLEMQVSSRDLRVHLETCSSSCGATCHTPMCKLCRGCIGMEEENVLRSAYLEHQRRRTWRRLIPRPFGSKKNAQRWNTSDDSEFSGLHGRNQLMTLWFHGKCLQDESWCL